MERRPGWSPPAWSRPWGGVSDPVGETSYRTDPAEGNGRDVEIHLGDGGKVGRGFIDDGVVHQVAP